MDQDLNLNLDIEFAKPKRYGDYYFCKIKNKAIQFPKMKIINSNSKNMELEFINDKLYNKEVYNFLSKLDYLIVETISTNSEQWFGKSIPIDSIGSMYNKFIKAPRTSENGCSIKLDFKIRKSGLETELIDKNNNSIDLDCFVVNNFAECISQLKYIIFSKDTCYITWEILVAKLYTPRKIKVKKYGFIPDVDDKVIHSDSDEESILSSFF